MIWVPDDDRIARERTFPFDQDRVGFRRDGIATARCEQQGKNYDCVSHTLRYVNCGGILHSPQGVAS